MNSGLNKGPEVEEISEMSKTKKIVIGVLIAIVVVIIAALVTIFKFDVFGMFTSEYKLDYDKYVTVGHEKRLMVSV